MCTSKTWTLLYPSSKRPKSVEVSGMEPALTGHIYEFGGSIILITLHVTKVDTLRRLQSLRSCDALAPFTTREYLSHLLDLHKSYKLSRRPALQIVPDIHHTWSCIAELTAAFEPTAFWPLKHNAYIGSSPGHLLLTEPTTSLSHHARTKFQTAFSWLNTDVASAFVMTTYHSSFEEVHQLKPSHDKVRGELPRSGLITSLCRRLMGRYDAKAAPPLRGSL